CEDDDACTLNDCDPQHGCQNTLLPGNQGFDGLDCRLTALAGEVNGAVSGDVSRPVKKKLKKFVTKVRAQVRKAKKVAKKPAKATRLLAAARTQLVKLGTMINTAARDAKKLKPELAARLVAGTDKVRTAVETVSGSLTTGK